MDRRPIDRDMLGHWVEVKGQIGFVYLDPTCGPSWQTHLVDENDPARGITAYILRLAGGQTSGRVLSVHELAERSLPDRPDWILGYGPQPPLEAPWRSDPLLLGHFSQEWCPDDLLVLVHDGDPRRTGRNLEGCWVRINGVEPAPDRPGFDAGGEPVLPPRGSVYIATLLNQPDQLDSVHEGDQIRFLPIAAGLPILVTEAYLAERSRWQIGTCPVCGLNEVFDPPSLILRDLLHEQNVSPAQVAFFAVPCARCHSSARPAGQQVIADLQPHLLTPVSG